jgi:hypothetical protein
MLNVAVVDVSWRTPWSGSVPCTGDIPVSGPPLGESCSSRQVLRFNEIARHAISCGQDLAARNPWLHPERVGVFAGHGGLRVNWQDLGPAMRQQHEDANDCWQRGLNRMHPLWIFRFLPNNAQGALAALIDARGEGAVCTGALGGAEALMTAEAALVAGAIDCAVVICYDARTLPELALQRHRSGDRRCGIDTAVGLLLRRAQPNAMSFSITTGLSDEAQHNPITGTDPWLGLDAGATTPALDLALAWAGKRWHGYPVAAEICYTSPMELHARLQLCAPMQERL